VKVPGVPANKGADHGIADIKNWLICPERKGPSNPRRDDQGTGLNARRTEGDRDRDAQVAAKNPDGRNQVGVRKST
jgi:hypothetical protein